MWFPNTAFSFRISIRRSGITRRARNIMCLGSGGRWAASLRWPLLRGRGAHAEGAEVVGARGYHAGVAEVIERRFPNSLASADPRR